MRSHTGPSARQDEAASGLRPTRAPVHASSGTRLGTARPRQEGPTDLRLVPPALAAWGTAALLLDASPAWVTRIVIGCLAAVGLLPLARRHRAASWPRASAAALLLCVAVAAASAGLHGADLRRGPVPGLARKYATVTAEVELTSDPRLTRPKVRGDHMAPTAVLIDADVRRVQEAGGTTVTTRTPVLVIVDVDVDVDAARSGRIAGARVRSPWLGLLPSTRLRVSARLAPATMGGDRVAAVLRVRDRREPDVVGEPSRPQRLAGRLRAGLREATDGLPADPRALLPGLVVGDTSRITPELEEAFKETDLTHTLAVSGANFTILLALLLGPPGLAQHVERRGLAPWLGISLRGTAVLGGVLSLGFVIVCRPDPSVVRAAACGAVALLALATGRRRSMIPALATAVLLLVLYDPWLARSYGFLLSVVATGALLTL
ncbi:ComEC/Rec2 family competence protein, partial [Streptomyces sp. NPDC006265]|uniref:ComEC/Rec2 family competence protein n=1 Tax=Streptomyces sp. NPDC006265 TaxID=3156740 RepID=UPI0033BDF4F2